MSKLLLTLAPKHLFLHYPLALKTWILPFFFGLIILLLQLIIYVIGVQLKPGELADPDCYMRLVRIEALMENHAWFDGSISRSNAPYGETSHWSRWLDLFIMALAMPFQLLLPTKSALFYSGVLISPLLQLLSVMALAWASRPFLKRIELPHLLLLFLSQASIILFFLAGRPDHHSLLILLFILSLGFLFRLLSGHATLVMILACAVTQAIAFAISLEFIIMIVLSLGLITLAWLTHHLKSSTGLLFSAALLLSCVLFYLLEQPWNHLSAVETDRMTLPHLIALTLVVCYWLMIVGLDQLKRLQSRISRCAITLIYGLASGYLLVRLFPILLGGPYGQMNPRLNYLWLKHVQEVQTLWQSDPGGITTLLIWLSPALIVFTTLLVCLWRKKLPADYLTWPWLTVLLSSVVFTLLTFYQIRWASYAQTALIFPLAAILGHALHHAYMHLSSQLFRWVRLGLLLLFCAGYLPIAALSLAPKLKSLSSGQESIKPSVKNNGHETRMALLAHWLESDPQFSRTERLLAHLDFGPELLYRTHHEVIATPYHRNGSGILFLYDLMNETSDATALAKLRERQITLILLKPDSSEKAFLNQSGIKATFYQRLVEGHYPDFLQPIVLPEISRKTFLIYRVLPQ